VSNLTAYLNDHLSGSAAASSLLVRLSRHYASEPLGAFFRGLLREVKADQATLEALTRRIGAEPSTLKRAAGWVAEKVARPKLTLRRPAPLGLFESLEVLSLGILGKRSLWRALAAVAPHDARLRSIDLGRLEHRATRQFERVEARRLAVARQTLIAEGRPESASARASSRKHAARRP
jgi:hypothetical protein